MNQSESKLGFSGTWSMAVGGMVGGGIFSTLGMVIGIAGAWAWPSFVAAVLAALGTLTTLFEAASLTFLFTFSVVCGLAFYKRAGVRIITGLGALTAAAASVALFLRLVQTNPMAIVFLGLLIVIAVFGRPALLRHMKTENRHG